MMFGRRDPLAFPKVRSGVVGKNDERPSLFVHAVRLFRTDLIFRSVVELTAIGIVVVGAKADFSGVGAFLTKLQPVAQSLGMPTQLSLPGFATGPKRYMQLQGPGSEIILTLINRGTLDQETLQHLSEPLAGALGKVADALVENQPQKALQLISVLDDSDPTVAYSKAVVLLRQIGPDRSAEARRLLKRATEKAVYPAYIVLGSHLMQQVFLNEIGELPAAQLMSTDDAGIEHTATREELVAEAALVFERAAAFGRADGQLLSGLARVRGYSGKVDYLAASTLWKDAAEHGNALAQYELGQMLLTGTGVQANSDDAIRLFRLARLKVPKAMISLATALLPKVMNGDGDLAREAISNLETYEATDTDFFYIAPKALQATPLPDIFPKALAYYLHGVYLLQAAPASMREPKEALWLLEKSAKLGSPEATFLVAESYRTGLAGKKDSVCAYGFHTTLRQAAPAKIDPILRELANEIGPEGVKRSEHIASAIQFARSIAIGSLNPMIVVPGSGIGVSADHSVCELETGGPTGPTFMDKSAIDDVISKARQQLQ
jgi:TPR repeat protein